VTPLVAVTDTEPLLPPQVGLVPTVEVEMFCEVTVSVDGVLPAQPFTAMTLTEPVLVLVVTLTEGSEVMESEVDQLAGKYHSYWAAPVTGATEYDTVIPEQKGFALAVIAPGCAGAVALQAPSVSTRFVPWYT
jgi:hypothetical protein